MSSVDDTIQERGKRYGTFSEQSLIAQNIKISIKNSPNWDRLRPDQREALEMIATKMSRILYGDSNYIDNWHDIACYATLIGRALARVGSK